MNRDMSLTKGILALAFVAIVSLIMSCTKSNPTNENAEAKEPVPDSVYVKKGNQIVALTFDTLRGSLLKAISSQGVEGAITFCNENAYPITATYADSVVIRRTALRYRNPSNKPDSLELLILEEMNEQMKSLKIPDTKIVRRSSTDEIHFFKPVMLQPMCLNCHGTPGTQVQNTTLARIQELYPDDRAVDFKEGDLRGVWHIIFKSQQENK